MAFALPLQDRLDGAAALLAQLADQCEDLRVRHDQLLELVAGEPQQDGVARRGDGRACRLPGEQRHLAEDVAFLQQRHFGISRGDLHLAVQDYVQAIRALPLDDHLLSGSGLPHAELLHDAPALRGVEVLEQRRDGHHVVEQPLPVEIPQRVDDRRIPRRQLAQQRVGHFEDLALLLGDDVRGPGRPGKQGHLPEERALAEVREGDLLAFGGGLVHAHPAFDDDEEAASGITLPDDEVTRKVPVVAKPVDEGDESVLWKIVEQWNLLRGDLRRRSACERRDVAECAIQVVVLGGDAGRLGGPAAGQLLVRADREQLDLLLRAAGEQVRDRSALASEFVAGDHFLVMRACDEVLGFRREDRVVGQRLGLPGRKVGIEIQTELALLGNRRSSRATPGGAPRQRRRASAEVEVQLATGGGRPRRGGEAGGGGGGRRSDRSAVIQLERLVLAAGGEGGPRPHAPGTAGGPGNAGVGWTLSWGGGRRGGPRGW